MAGNGIGVYRWCGRKCQECLVGDMEGNGDVDWCIWVTRQETERCRSVNCVQYGRNWWWGNKYTVWVIRQDLMRGEPVGHKKQAYFLFTAVLSADFLWYHIHPDQLYRERGSSLRAIPGQCPGHHHEVAQQHQHLWKGRAPHPRWAVHFIKESSLLFSSLPRSGFCLEFLWGFWLVCWLWVWVQSLIWGFLWLVRYFSNMPTTQASWCGVMCCGVSGLCQLLWFLTVLRWCVRNVPRLCDNVVVVFQECAMYLLLWQCCGDVSGMCILPWICDRVP